MMARTFPDRGSPPPPIALELGLILNSSVEFLSNLHAFTQCGAPGSCLLAPG